MNKFTVLICAFLFLGITANAQLTLSTTILDQVTCNGGSNGSIKANPSGGTSPYTYLWSPSSQTIRIAESLTAGTYTITVTDHLGATATATATITQPTAIIVTASAKQSSICPGHEDSLYSSASGGNPPYTYYWTAPYSDISCPSCANTNSFPYGSPYMVTAITDKTGCSATASVSVIVKAFPYVTITGPINPIAPGRSDTLIASSVIGGTYLWSNSSTTSSIIVSPGVSTTYSVKATNNGCYDTAHYTIDTDRVGNGSSSSSPIRIVPSSSFTTQSFSTLDSVVWFSFIPTDSNNQIIANSAYLGYPVPHVHRLTLFNSSLNTVVDEPMPDIQGANQIRIDISHLDIGSTYYVRASRTPAHTNMPGCNPTGDVCNASQRWSFQLAIRTIPIFVPQDSGAEPFGVNQLYYESRGQIEDLNKIPRFDIKAYTNNAVPAVYASDSAVSFVYSHTDTSASSIDTVQRVDMVLTGSSLQPTQPVFKMQEDSNAGYLNYFLGFVPNGVPKVEGYSRLVYKNVYPNVDMHVYSNTTGTKFYFVCNPAGGGGAGGNPANIEIKFKGANSVTISSDSGVSIATELGTLNFAPGYAYEDSSGIIVATHWHANFEAVNSTTVKFHVGTYNTNEPLVIEIDRGKVLPLVTSCIDNLCWSTYDGGSSGDYYYGVTTDNSNNTYATGFTGSSDFPVTNGAFQGGLLGQYNVTVAKFAVTTHAPLWATYYGGGDIDEGNSIAVDAAQNVYVTGYTNSPNFPVQALAGAYNQPGGLNGDGAGPDYDAFVVKLNPTGTAPIWATFYGGFNGGNGDGELGNHIVLDGLNNIYVVGGYMSPSANAPTVPTYSVVGAYNSLTGSGWIAKFSTNGVQEWGTQIGGVSAMEGTDIVGAAVDANNNLFITGQTTESGYPVVNAGANAAYIGGVFAGLDAVVTKFNTSNAIVWSTYYAGDGDDQGYSITTDNAGNAYVTGNTNSPGVTTSLLLATGPYNQGYGATAGTGTDNGFIAEFSSTGTMSWSTYFGGGNYLEGRSITFDNNDGDLYLTGYNPAPGGGMPLPGTNPSGTYSVVTNSGSNAFVAAFDHWGYLWGTYFGGTGADQGWGITTDGADNLYIVGNTNSQPNFSPSFPLVDNPSSGPNPCYYQGNYGGGTRDAFISQFTLSSVTGISNISDPEGEIKVYPNPTSQNITVEMELNEQETVGFTLYNLLGEVVYSEDVKGKSGAINKQISLFLLSEGTYILKVVAGNHIYHQKIVKLQ